MADNRSRPFDVFISRFDADGAAAVEFTVRRRLQPANPVTTKETLGRWPEQQHAENAATTQTPENAWDGLSPLSCYNDLEVWVTKQPLHHQVPPHCIDSIRRFSTMFVRSLLLQTLSLTFAREAARHLSWGAVAETSGAMDLPTHSP